MIETITQHEAENGLNLLIINAHELLKKDWYSRNKLIENVIIAVYYTFDIPNNKSISSKIYNVTFEIINTLLEQSNLPLASHSELVTVVDNF